MQHLLLSLSLLASAAVGALASDDLKIDVTLPVECERKTQKGDTINVHYRGTLQSTGATFDASYDRGTPFSFKLGSGMVIKGWDEGLLDMCIGEKRTLTIGPSYGYGDRNIGPIPAGSTLIFETEMMGIEGVPQPESIVTKSATDSPASSASEKVAEKVASAVSWLLFSPPDHSSRATFLCQTTGCGTDQETWSTPARMHKRSRCSRLRSWLPPLNFITIHYAYFIIGCLVSSVIFWGSSNPARSISYTDSLFLVVSAMTESGLNTVNLSQMTTWQQTLLLLLIIFGSSIWVSIWTVVARKHVFEQRFHDIVRAERTRRANHPGGASSPPRIDRFLSCRRASTKTLPPVRTETVPDTTRGGDVAALAVDAKAPRGKSPSPDRIAFANTPNPVDAVSTAAQHHPRENQATRRTLGREGGSNPDQKDDEFSMHQLLAGKSGGRNSQFHGLTTEERERLGGCEYQALRVLSVIVPVYFILWQLLGCLALGAWINNNLPGPPLENGIKPWWLGIFNGVSAFNNWGMSLLDANMIPFQNSTFVLLTMGLLILAGITAYPVFLRLIVWSLRRLLTLLIKEDEYTGLKDTLKFILRYPRRVYTNLFAARPTWWLVGFELLNLHNPAIQHIPPRSRVLDGLFQALVYPVVITMRHSNVYEERSLGIYTEDEVPTTDPEKATTASIHSHRRHRGNSSSSMLAALGRVISHAFTLHGVGARAPPPSNQGAESHINFITQQIHGQLAHDIWWLVLAILVIVTINTDRFLADPVRFSVFNVIFEVVSAYGCVGISVGAPGADYSFSGAWHPASKLVLCAVMLRGRHRGLPVALDRAVRLPREELLREEEEDQCIRRSMAVRRTSVDV
ncbi:hypothetical protein F5144DRAFT_595959 [Chaetomium tenue]|uniref:Uncharacterized protein n=1 Tax=Chaetomium tenue TaxID=1854479 RepID=A0ACB7P011_9PEZI|nr:hypothetical protein F5144DRAFT_595959 [Chaetomium globosum]